MQAVQVFADDVGVEQGEVIIANQYRYFAQRIECEYFVIAHDRAGFVVDHLQSIGQAEFVGGDQRLAGVGGVCLVEKFHRWRR